VSETAVPRYVVTTRRGAQSTNETAETALDVVSADPNVRVVGYANPNTVTIETMPETADALRKKLQGTHFVEPEIRRSLL
jgi:hypothetical protein